MSAGSWSWNPEALALVVPVAAYAAGASRVPPPRWRVTCFAAGIGLLAAAFVTPLDTIARHYLLAGHLLQNVVLAEWAPALLVLGVPRVAAAALERRPGFRRATHPLLTLPLWLGTYFVWHVPVLYDAGLRHQNSLLPLEHACYLLAGLAFWWPVIHRRMHAGAKASYLVAAFVLASPLGLLLALVPDAVYGFYEDGPGLWGLAPLTDQQIAGVTMAAEQAVVFFGAFATFFVRFLREEDFAGARGAL